MNELTARNTAVLDQGLELIDALLGSSSAKGALRVAPHFRHCIDFYDCFLSGLETGRIDYDARSRSAELESDLGSVDQALRRIRERLLGIGSLSPRTPVQARSDAPEENSPWTSSTLGRELLFLLSHTIHHYALIDLMLREEGFEPPSEFGVAPSTLRHLERETEPVHTECAR